MASTMLAIVGFFKRAPPPPPPPVAEPFNFMPVLLAMLFGWVLPALTFLALTGKSKDKNGAPPISYSRNASFNSASSLYAAAANGAKVATGPTAADAPRKTHRGVLLGSASVFMMVSSAAITFPFMQTRRDALSCDALCQGGQTSLRSALNLVGASLIGRASDTLGRVPMLWVGICATLCGLGINYGMDSLEGMWLSLIPVALLNQNFSVSKALFSDYIDEVGGSDADRAGAVGKLGMAVGFAFMFGPILATVFVTEYSQALIVSAMGTAVAALILIMLPTPAKTSAPEANGRANGNGGSHAAAASTGIMSFLRMPVLQTRGAQLLMAVRLLMALAFHMFAPVWQVSIKNRFNFAPKDHAQFMGLIGLTYALSQGLVAKPMIRRTGSDPTRLLLMCIMLLGGARPFALLTSSVGVVYVLYVPMVIALGVMNTAITTACSGLAAGDQLGGLFGVLESVESIAGMVGPALGGLISRTWQEHGALAAVVSCYAMAFTLIALFFGKCVVAPAAASKAKAKRQ